MPDPKEPYSEEERIRVAAGSVGGDAASARETDGEDAAPKRRHLIPDSRLPMMEDPDEEAGGDAAADPTAAGPTAGSSGA